MPIKENISFTTVARCLSSWGDYQRWRFHAAVRCYCLKSAEWELWENMVSDSKHVFIAAGLLVRMAGGGRKFKGLSYLPTSLLTSLKLS